MRRVANTRKLQNAIKKSSLNVLPLYLSVLTTRLDPCVLLVAIKYMQLSIEMLRESGRTHPAANQQKQLAEILEVDLMDIKGAMQAYITAGTWYEEESSPA